MLSYRKEEDSRISIVSNFENVQVARDMFLDFLYYKKIQADLIKEWELVFSEVINNAIKHTSTDLSEDAIQVAWSEIDNLIMLKVEGLSSGPCSKKFENPSLPLDPYQVSGRGLYIIQHFCDVWLQRRSSTKYTQFIGKYS